MKIVYSSDHPKSFSFAAIATGEIFKQLGDFDIVYMKIHRIQDNLGLIYNAVEVDGGNLIRFKDNDQVILYNAELRLWR